MLAGARGYEDCAPGNDVLLRILFWFQAFLSRFSTRLYKVVQWQWLGGRDNRGAKLQRKELQCVSHKLSKTLPINV